MAAMVFEHITIYSYSLILGLAALTGVCLFRACWAHLGLAPARGAAATAVGVAAALVLARLVYWYCRPDSFDTLAQALTTPGTGSLALAGAFLGCGLTALVLGRAWGCGSELLDSMSLAGCAAIALGRLGDFFTAYDRGQMLQNAHFPWAYPVINAASGLPEYRFATFVFQAAVAAALFCVLAWGFFTRRRRRGDTALLFLLVYSASQVLLDSTRYDSLYLRSNGFVSMVQVLSAGALGFCVAVLARRGVKRLGRRRWMVPVWLALGALFGGAGYMEYYVQRHGAQAVFAYSVMGACLAAIVALALLLGRTGEKKT